MTPPQSAAREIAPLWRLAFRAGFLAAGAFAVLAMVRWLYWMLRPEAWQGPLFPHWWHAHEMVFGFAMPVVGGFLLTAVATWTGTRGTRGTTLKWLFGFWLAARLLLWLAPGREVLAWAMEMLFIGLLMVELGRRVLPARQWRNVLFLPVLLVLALLSSFSYWRAQDPVDATRLHFGAVWMVTLLVVIIGGRVIPLFTANRLGLTIAPLPTWFEHCCIGVVLLVGLATAFLPGIASSPWLTWLCLVGGLAHLYRLARWQGWRTGRVPLLWSMHLSYLCIPLALLGFATTGADPVAPRNLIHLLAIGTVGGMILTMMSRVSLGHTGRPLEVPAYLAWAFALLLLAALLRALGPLVDPAATLWYWRLSAVLWIVAFGCFLWRYLPILTAARADGRPG